MGVKNMKIHFVCLGNTYRSRLAEAYMNSLKLRGVRAVSSGIIADTVHAPINWYALRMLEQQGMSRRRMASPRLSTRANVHSSDCMIFFTRKPYEFCKAWMSPGQDYQIWNIADMQGGTHGAKIRESERTFKQIKHRVDALIKYYALR